MTSRVFSPSHSCGTAQPDTASPGVRGARVRHPRLARRHPARWEAADRERASVSGNMSEISADIYEQHRKRCERRREMVAAWLMVLLAALLFVGLEPFLGGVPSVVPKETATLVGTFVDRGDRIDWSSEEGSGATAAMTDSSATR